MSVYKYTSFENLVHILNGSIRLTQPSAFNDPFEFLPEIYYTEEGYTNINIGIDVLSRPRETCVRLPNNFKDDYCNDITSRRLIKEISKSVGVLCLSKNSNSLLMWSHYASEYRGAIIEFDESHEFFEHIHPVRYEKIRPKLDFSDLLSDSNEIIISELCYKPDVWSYEEEVRIIRSFNDCESKGNGIYTMSVPLEAIKSIIIGERMPIENIRVVIDKIKETNIIVNYALISNWEYKFRYELIKGNKPFSEEIPGISPRTAHIFKNYSGLMGEIARLTIKHHPMSEIVNLTV